MDIQDYNMYRNMFLDFDKVGYYLQNNILYDHVIAFPQWNPDYIPQLISGLLSNLFYDCSNKFSFSLNDFVNLTKKILNLGSKKNVLRIERTELYSHFPDMNTKAIDEVLSIISHNRKEIYNNFLLHTDISDFSQKPLIQRNKNEFVLINPAFCSFAFYEAISDVVRKEYRKMN